MKLLYFSLLLISLLCSQNQNIIINDGSKDQTIQIINQYRKHENFIIKEFGITDMFLFTHFRMN